MRHFWYTLVRSVKYSTALLPRSPRVLFFTSAVVEADLSGLDGWYWFNSSHWYGGGADVCKGM